MTKTTFPLLGLVLFLSAGTCGSPRAPDDSSDPGPADGETGGQACEAEIEKIKNLESELAQCREPK